jgi:catalase
VLYDAVAVVPSSAEVESLALEKPALDFVNDAYAHCKFIGVGADAGPLLEAAGVAGKMDEGFVQVTRASAAGFIEQCGALRFWDRPH